MTGAIAEILSGFGAFVKVAIYIFIIVEISILVEEFIAARLELRRGFAGTKTSPLRIFARHGIKILRTEGSFGQHLASGAKFLVIFLAAGLLPLWFGQIPLSCAHSFWIFTTLVIAGPVLHLILEWAFKRGSGWPLILVTSERTIGSCTVHFILAITLIAMTGVDNFSGFRDLQENHSWIIWRYPWAIFILFAYAVANLFTSFQTIFARDKDEKAAGWSFDELLPQMRRAVWTLFMVDVFLGGASTTGMVGNIGLILKSVLINVASSLASQLFFRLREDQAEAFILWRLTPISILILALSLLIPGGVS